MNATAEATPAARMSLGNVKSGRMHLKPFVLLYGPDGVGKSTFGADAPAPIFLGTEQGFGELNVAHFATPRNWNEIVLAIDELQNGDHEFETLVIDSIDWIEPVCWRAVCEENKWTTIEDPGYGKGYTAALLWWQQMIRKLKRLRMKMGVIVIAHAQIKGFNDPTENVSYDRFQLKLNDKASALWREATDAVLFANFSITTKEEKGKAKAKAYGQGERVMFTERRPSFDAKNRNNLPLELPLSWTSYADAVATDRAAQLDGDKTPAKRNAPRVVTPAATPEPVAA